MTANIQPVIDELKVELGDIQDKLNGVQLSEEDSLKLNQRKQKIFEILATYYGYSTDQIKEIVK